MLQQGNRQARLATAAEVSEANISLRAGSDGRIVLTQQQRMRVFENFRQEGSSEDTLPRLRLTPKSRAGQILNAMQSMLDIYR